MRKLALHWQILLGMFFGVLFGLLFSQFDWGKQLVIDWIKPLGTIFINSLKLIAVPLILASLVKGVPI
jgi:Na+/H+-dicarboxylate symporter